jgi:hypothetical protein
MRRSFRLIMLSSICCLLFGNCRTSFVSDCLKEDIVFLDDDKSNNLAKKKNVQPRVDTLFVKTYPSFSTTLEMIPKYRKASLISFNKYGNISQSEIIG